MRVDDNSKLTKNFSLNEYCFGRYKGEILACGEDSELTAKAITFAIMLQEFREWYGKPMTISCWQRPPKFNAKKGGTKNSGHITGSACDILIKTDEATFKKYRDKWFAICKKNKVIGAIGYYPNEQFIHFESCVDWASKNTYWKKNKNGNLEYNF